MVIPPWDRRYSRVFSDARSEHGGEGCVQDAVKRLRKGRCRDAKGNYQKEAQYIRARWENCHGLVPSDCSGINSVVYAISMATKDECEARQKEDMLLAYVPVFQMLLCRYKEPSSYF